MRASPRARSVACLAQDQDRPLARRQLLHRRDEGELERLELLVAGVGRGVAVLDLQRLVRVGLEPDLLADRVARGLVGIGRGPVLDRQQPPLAAGDDVEAGVGGDLVEPGAQRGAATEAAEPAPDPQPRLLQRVLGVVQRAEQAVAVRVQLPPVGLNQALEGALVTAAGGLEQNGLGHRSMLIRRIARS